MVHGYARGISLMLAIVMLFGVVSSAYAEAPEISISEEAALISEEAAMLSEETVMLPEAAAPIPEEDAASTIVESEPVSEENSGYPWNGMTDDDFIVFILSEAYREYLDDPDAFESILARIEWMEDVDLREELALVLLESMSAEPDMMMGAFGGVSLASSAPDLEDSGLNNRDMFFKQSTRGTCTLTACAMLVRRAAKLNGNPNWSSVTEQSLRSTAWIEGTGMRWSFSYAGIDVGHGSFSGCTMDTVISMLNQHPEGFVAYNSSIPHAVLVTDYTNGTIYCSDPGYDPSRKPLVQTLLGKGSQEASVAGFTAYWYVTSPKLKVVHKPKPLEIPIELTGTKTSAGKFAMRWNAVGSAGYWVYRSESPNGPWDKAVYTALGGNTTEWTEESGDLLTTYYYCVQSFDAERRGGCRSNVISFMPDRTETHLSEGTCGENIRWAVYDDGLLLIKGKGAMPDFGGQGSAPWSAQSGSIRQVTVSEGITSIGKYAFSGCSQMSSISVPATVTSIGDWSFSGCRSLSSVSVGSAKSIGYAAFRECTGLQELALPSSVTAIGDWAFSLCSGLTKVILPEGMTAVGASAFYGDNAIADVTLPSTLKTIGANAFRDCIKLQSVSIPAAVESIGTYAFATCTGINSLHFERTYGILKLGEGAFFNCAGISTLYLPAIQAEAQAFAYCYGLRYLVLSENGTQSILADNTFQNCTRLAYVMVYGGSVKSSVTAFSGTPAEIFVSRDSYGSDFVKNEGGNVWRTYWALGNCGGSCFWYLDHTGTLTFFGEGAVSSYQPWNAPWSSRAASVATVEVRSGITGLGNNLFVGCGNLKNIYLRQTKAPSIGEEAFAKITATVTYHSPDSSWNTVAGKNYGGTISWYDGHSFLWEITKAPTLSASGELAAVCTSCKLEKKVELPKLDQENYTYTESGGKGTYTWKVTEYGEYSFHVSAAAILSHPTDVTVAENQVAYFTVEAKGVGLKYQWQWRSDTTPWTNSTSKTSGYNSATLRISGISTRNGFRYRCVVTDSFGHIMTSNEATLTIQIPLRITSQPVDKSVYKNATALFTVEATGSGLKYQWQWKNATSDWTNCTNKITGYNTKTLKPMGIIERNGFQYRCVVTDRYGSTAISSAATLNIRASVVILSQPTDMSVKENATASFKVSAEGNGLKYQWQWKNYTSDWQNCTAKTAGYNSAVLKPVGIPTRNGFQYRCIVTASDGAKVTSQTAVLSVEVSGSKLQIQVQPVSQTVPQNSTAVFFVTASGSVLKYQWQWKSGIRDWTNCTSATKGYNTATLCPVANVGRDGFQYRCVITDSTGKSVITNTAVLTLGAGLPISVQPESQSVQINTYADFRVAANGTNLKYQWQWKTGDRDWTNCTSVTKGYNTSNLQPLANNGRNGFQYRCVITDASGKAAISDVAVLTVLK